MDDTQIEEEKPIETADKPRKKRKNRVAMTERIVSGGVIISFIGVLCFAALLIVMLVIKI